MPSFAVRLWEGTTWQAEPSSGEPPRFTLVLQHPGALRKMFLPPSELNLGEAYIQMTLTSKEISKPSFHLGITSWMSAGKDSTGALWKTPAEFAEDRSLRPVMPPRIAGHTPLERA